MSPTSDIDCLCIAPKYATIKAYFFGLLHEILENHNHVSDLTKVQSAWVPVMKFKFSGIEIDLTYANINRENL